MTEVKKLNAMKMALARARLIASLLSLFVALWITHSAALTTTEQQDILNIHNTLRRGEGSSNMQILVSYSYQSSNIVLSFQTDCKSRDQHRP